MKKETIQAIAAALHALADEFLGSPSSPDAAPEALTVEPVTTGKRRGRPAATTATTAPAEPSSTPAPASSSAPADPKEEICTYCGYARGMHFADGLHCPSNQTSSAKPLQSVFTTAPVGSDAMSTNGKTAEGLWIENKALIEPLVKSGRGQEVTAVVNKYVSGPGLKMKDIPVDKIPAFRRDIEALTI